MRPAGYVHIFTPDGTVDEYETLQCVHCQALLRMTRDRVVEESGWCGQCGAVICGRCVSLGRCIPFEKALLAYERRQAFGDAIFGPR